jgi:hypothetical protein
MPRWIVLILLALLVLVIGLSLALFLPRGGDAPSGGVTVLDTTATIPP